MRYVSVGRRLVAALVDSFVAFLGFGFAVAALTGNLASTPEGVEFQLEGAAALALLGLCVGYFVVMEAAFGATLGKYLLGLRVRGEDGNGVGVGAALVRNFVRIIDVFCGLGAVLIWSSSRRQRLGDLLARTVVVRA
jgi:uncharacterized RDD family membrane protein YckC